jgi:hypothetical protein
LLAIKLRSPVPLPISRTVEHPSGTRLQMADSKHFFLKTSLSMGEVPSLHKGGGQVLQPVICCQEVRV